MSIKRLETDLRAHTLRSLAIVRSAFALALDDQTALLLNP
jgi:hypothetical protein